MPLNELNFFINFFKNLYIYIYKNNKEKLQEKVCKKINVFLKKKTGQNYSRELVNNAKIYQKIKSKSLLRIAKNIIKREKNPRYNYEKLFKKSGLSFIGIFKIS